MADRVSRAHNKEKIYVFVREPDGAGNVLSGSLFDELNYLYLSIYVFMYCFLVIHLSIDNSMISFKCGHSSLS